MSAKIYGPSETHPRTRIALLAAKFEGADAAFSQTSFPVSDDYKSKFPLGRVPALEQGDFLLTETVAIATYLARENKAGLLGNSKEEAALVLQWSSWANQHVLPQYAQWALPLKGGNPRFPYNKSSVEAAKAKVHDELKYLDNALKTKTFLVGNRITLADLFVASILAAAVETVLDAEVRKTYVNVFRHLNTIVNQEAYKAVSPAPTFTDKAITYTPPKKEAKPAAAAPAPKAAPAPAAAANEEEAPAAPKPKHPCEALGQPKSFPFDEWKRQYSNNDTPVAMKWLEEHYDETASQEYSFWRADYKYNDELTQVFMSSNLITGFHSRLEGSRKYVFGSAGVYGKNNDNAIMGVYMIRGSDYKAVFDVAPDYESYEFKPLDFKADRELIAGSWAWENTLDGKEYADGKVMK